MTETNRREFLKFLSSSGLMLSQLGLLSATASSCATISNEIKDSSLIHFSLTDADELVLAKGLQYEILFKWNDVIRTQSKGEFKYGAHNDHIQFIPIAADVMNEGYLMVNHEYVNPLFVSGWSEKNNLSKTKEQVITEMKSVGISVLHIRKEKDSWQLVQNSDLNFRIDGLTEIPFSSGVKIAGSSFGVGTLANCAGGQTSWGTFLTCEENYDLFYGEYNVRPHKKENKLRKIPQVLNHKKDMFWHLHFNHSPYHYGWVVEIHPKTQAAKKLISLGRFAHEGATCVKAHDGREVVYMGDDANNEFIYKFISSVPGSLEKGTLYVANTEQGRWLPVEIKSHPDFKILFQDQTELMIHTRLAAKMLGATPQDRPEDIEVHPETKEIIVALTNNKKAGRPHGSLLKIKEKNNDFLSLEFSSDSWVSFGDDSTLSSPDNLAFDRSGNLWVTNDISEDDLGKDEYKKFKRNGLYYIPIRGKNAGQIFQVASAPNDAELTGPYFSADGKDLFLCVQHPGELSPSKDQLTSTWPDRGNELPKSSLVVIRGPTLEKLTSF